MDRPRLPNFFLCFFFFGIKLGHFTINNFFLYVTETQAYQWKMEKFFVTEEKKFGRIDSGGQFHQHFMHAFLLIFLRQKVKKSKRK